EVRTLRDPRAQRRDLPVGEAITLRRHHVGVVGRQPDAQQELAVVRMLAIDDLAALAAGEQGLAAVEPQAALRLAQAAARVGVGRAVAVEAALAQDRQHVALELDALLRRRRGGEQHDGDRRCPHANSAAIGRPVSATRNGRPGGEITTWSTSRPSAWAIVALKSGTVTGSSTTASPRSSVLPCRTPPLMPPPASRQEKACGWWLRPSRSAVISGVRPNSVASTTSVSSSMPRASRSESSVDSVRSRRGHFSSIASKLSTCVSQPPLCTSTKRTPCSHSRRASSTPWPKPSRP